MGSSYLYSIYIEPLKGCCMLYTRNLNGTTCWTVCFENIHFDGKSSLSLLRLPLGLRLDSIKHCLKNIPWYKRNQTRFAYKVCVIYGFNHLDLYPKYFLFCESHSNLDKVRVKSPYWIIDITHIYWVFGSSLTNFTSFYYCNMLARLSWSTILCPYVIQIELNIEVLCYKCWYYTSWVFRFFYCVEY